MSNRKNGPWNESVLDQLLEWDPKWAEACTRLSNNPWESGVLSEKFIELVCVGLNAACTNLNADGTRRHMQAALAAGATRDEIVLVLKCAAVMALHSCSLGAPILLEEAKAAGIQPTKKATSATPAIDKMKAIGQWNDAWNPFLELDPQWTDEFMLMGGGIYGSRVMSAKEIELMSIAFDASFTHMYAPGTRRHIQNALKAGATTDEIMEVLKLCVSEGVQAFNLGIPILVELIRTRSTSQDSQT
jgi:alkylhydroperoxidase/carboxymuconolactone decarboxylase family protein YurZ